MSSSILPGVFLATAMAVSATVVFLSLRREKNLPPTTQFPENQVSHPPNQIPRSCLSSDCKKRGRKKKRVQFAESVKDQTGNSDEYRKKSTAGGSRGNCRCGIDGIQANRVALYSGILRDRVQRLECSY